MGNRLWTRQMRYDMLESWGDELPGLSLNYFADELPAAYHRDGNRKGFKHLPVLRRCETRAKIRRALLASSLALLRDYIAGEIYHMDIAIREGRMSEYVWAWAGELPSAFEARYDRDFFRRLLALSIGMWERMEAGKYTTPICTAEEILLGLVLAEYENRLGHAKLPPGYVDLDSYWLEDDDYLLLYNLDSTNADEVLAALERELFTSNLDFDSWFEPFYDNFEVPGPASEMVMREINGIGR